VYIYSFYNYKEIVIDRLSNKKLQLKKRFNRTDNFINLTLLGVQNCLDNIKIDSRSSIYLASRKGNINATLKALNVIFLEQKLPMPFNFLNTVNASTLFFIAKNFNIDGKTLFVDRFESALPQAFIDTKNRKSVILGIVEEAISDLELHKKKFKTKEIIERSQWLLLSSNIKGQKPIAKIYDIKITTNIKEQSRLDDLFNFLEDGEGIFEFKSRNLSFLCEVII
jgi:hypothetical protein